MNNYFKLLKVLYKNARSPFTNGTGKTKILRSVLGWIFLIAVTVPLFIGIVELIFSGYDLLAKMNQQSLLLGTALAVNCVILLIFGVFYVINEFYYSSNLESILPLPLTPGTIFGAKFTLVVIYEYLSEILFLAPVLVAYGYKAGAGVIYYLYALMVYMLLPILPLAIDSILCMVIMRFTNIFKNKDLFKILGGMLGVGIGVGINVVMNSMGGNITPQQLQKILTNKNGMVNLITEKLFPTSKIASTALLNYSGFEGFRNIFNFLLITVLVIALLVFISNRIYFKGALGLNQATTKKNKISKTEMNKATDQNSVVKTLVIREFRTIIRTPAYFMNCFIMNYIGPVIVLLILLSKKNKMPDISKLSLVFTNQHALTLILAISIGVIVFLVISNPIAATAISREGTNIFVNKYLPVSYNIQILSKIITGIVVNISGILVLLVIMAVIAKPPLYFILIVALLAVLATVLANVIGLFIDLVKPKLVWDDETKAVKQNMNVLISMVVNIVVQGALLYFLFKLSLSFTAMVIALVAVYAAAIVLLSVIMSKVSFKTFQNL